MTVKSPEGRIWMARTPGHSSRRQVSPCAFAPRPSICASARKPRPTTLSPPKALARALSHSEGGQSVRRNALLRLKDDDPASHVRSLGMQPAALNWTPDRHHQLRCPPKKNRRGPTEYDRRAAPCVALDIAIPQHLYVLAQHERFISSYSHGEKSTRSLTRPELRANISRGVRLTARRTD
jgi:hypothetical protein